MIRLFRTSQEPKIYEFEPEYNVEFEVTPPSQLQASDRGGGRIRLAQSEGILKVTVKNGALHVNGWHAIQIEPHGDTSCTIRFRESEPEFDNPPRFQKVVARPAKNKGVKR